MDNPNKYPFSDLERNVVTSTVVCASFWVAWRQQVDMFPRGSAARKLFLERLWLPKRAAGIQEMTFGSLDHGDS